MEFRGALFFTFFALSYPHFLGKSPKKRAYVDTILSAMGLSINRLFDILRVSKGLSLNDCYWVTEGGFDGTFEKYNLYDNRCNRTLGQIAFTGYGSNPSRLTSSPELTTNGMLRKCWRRENGIVRLYKGGTEGASNAGNVSKKPQIFVWLL